MKCHNPRTPVVSSLTINTVRRAPVILSVFIAGLFFSGCATHNATVTIHIFGGRSMQEGEGNEMEAPSDIHDLIGDFDVPVGPQEFPDIDLPDLELPNRGGGKDSPAMPVEVAPPAGLSSTHPLPPPTNITKTSIFIESTKDGPNRTRLPSGRGAVAVLNGQWLGKISEVSVAGVSFSNATDYTKLPNGSREHWRNGTHAKEFHGKIISVTFKDGTTLTDKLDGSGGRLYRDNKLILK